MGFGVNAGEASGVCHVSGRTEETGGQQLRRS